jgi:hypothetical protein
MKKQLVIVGTAVLLLVVGLSGCNELNPLSSEEDRFVGTWKQNKEYGIGFTLFSDGTGSWQSVSTTWELKDGKFTIYFSGVYLIYNYEFSNNYQTLSLEETNSGLKYEFIKQ